MIASAPPRLARAVLSQIAPAHPLPADARHSGALSGALHASAMPCPAKGISAAPTLPPRAERPLRRALLAIWAGLARRRQRQRLALLDARLLADIGLSRQQAADEIGRPIWDPPLHWRR